jgi:hypothetical protein
LYAEIGEHMAEVATVLKSSGFWRGPVRWMLKKLFYTRHVKKLELTVRTHLDKKFGDAFFTSLKLNIDFGGPVTRVDEYQRRVYVPTNEILKISALTEALLVQELMKASSLREISIVNPRFAEAVAVWETSELLSQREDGAWRADEYYSMITRTIIDNEYFETVRTMDEHDDLHKLVITTLEQIRQTPKQQRRFNTRLKLRCNQTIDETHEKHRKRILKESRLINDLDTISNEQFIQKITQIASSKHPQERNHRCDEHMIAQAIVKGEPIYFTKTQPLSYYEVAKHVIEHPGSSIAELQTLGRRGPTGIYFAILVLMPQGTGLGLIRREKQKRGHRFYPTDKLLNLIKQYNATETFQTDQ